MPRLDRIAACLKGATRAVHGRAPPIGAALGRRTCPSTLPMTPTYACQAGPVGADARARLRSPESLPVPRLAGCRSRRRHLCQRPTGYRSSPVSSTTPGCSRLAIARSGCGNCGRQATGTGTRPCFLSSPSPSPRARRSCLEVSVSATRTVAVLPVSGACFYIDKPPAKAMTKRTRGCALLAGRRAPVLHAYWCRAALSGTGSARRPVRRKPRGRRATLCAIADLRVPGSRRGEGRSEEMAEHCRQESIGF